MQCDLDFKEKENQCCRRRGIVQLYLCYIFTTVNQVSNSTQERECVTTMTAKVWTTFDSTRHSCGVFYASLVRKCRVPIDSHSSSSSITVSRSRASDSVGSPPRPLMPLTSASGPQIRSTFTTKRVLYLFLACMLGSMLWFYTARGWDPARYHSLWHPAAILDSTKQASPPADSNLNLLPATASFHGEGFEPGLSPTMDVEVVVTEIAVEVVAETVYPSLRPVPNVAGVIESPAALSQSTIAAPPPPDVRS